MIFLFLYVSSTKNDVFDDQISATDPVSTLATFSEFGVDPILNAIVLATSVIDDAIAFAFFSTFNEFIGSGYDIRSASASVGLRFLYIFIGSSLLGYFQGVAMAWFLQHHRSIQTDYSILAALIVCFVYISFLSSQLLQVRSKHA